MRSLGENNSETKSSGNRRMPTAMRTAMGQSFKTFSFLQSRVNGGHGIRNTSRIRPNTSRSIIATKRLMVAVMRLVMSPQQAQARQNLLREKCSRHREDRTGVFHRRKLMRTLRRGGSILPRTAFRASTPRESSHGCSRGRDRANRVRRVAIVACLAYRFDGAAGMVTAGRRAGETQATSRWQPAIVRHGVRAVRAPGGLLAVWHRTERRIAGAASALNVSADSWCGLRARCTDGRKPVCR